MANVEKNNEYVREYILDWSIEDDSYQSWFEKSQMEYDGKVVCPEPTVEYSELNGAFA
jgi:hypothetical protein